MTDGSRRAEAVRCERCGGALPPRQLAEELPCPSCGHRQRLDARLLASLESYGAEAARDLEQVASHRREEQALVARRRTLGRAIQLAVLLMTPLILGTGLAVVALPLLHGLGVFDWNGLEPETKTAIIVSCFAFSTVVGAGLGLIAFVAGRSKSVGAAANARSGDATASDIQTPVAGVVLCPRCGGPNDLHAGVATEACRFCHSTFAPSEAVRAAGLDASERARRDAALQRYRGERMTVAGLASQTKGQRLQLPVAGAVAAGTGMFGSIFCLGSCFGAAQTVTGAQPASVGALLGGGALAAALLGIAAASGWVLSKQLKRSRAEKLETARVWGGTPMGGVMATAHWLSRHWAGPYELELLQIVSAEGYEGAHGELAGYPWLFERESGAPRGRAQVLVAAFFNGAPDLARAPDDARRVLSQLEREGVRASVDEAGARAWLDPATASPPRVHALRDRLVFLVTRLGGRPLTAPARSV